jgi:hypothetical protein
MPTEADGKDVAPIKHSLYYAQQAVMGPGVLGADNVRC